MGCAACRTRRTRHGGLRINPGVGGRVRWWSVGIALAHSTRGGWRWRGGDDGCRSEAGWRADGVDDGGRAGWRGQNRRLVVDLVAEAHRG
eukprot:6758378-Prymnesium_polylepis.1